MSKMLINKHLLYCSSPSCISRSCTAGPPGTLALGTSIRSIPSSAPPPSSTSRAWTPFGREGRRQREQGGWNTIRLSAERGDVSGSKVGGRLVTRSECVFTLTTPSNSLCGSRRPSCFLLPLINIQCRVQQGKGPVQLADSSLVLRIGPG